MNRKFWKVWASVMGVAVLVPALIWAYLRGTTVGVNRADTAALEEWFLANVPVFRLWAVVLALSGVVLAGGVVAAIARGVSQRSSRAVP